MSKIVITLISSLVTLGHGVILHLQLLPWLISVLRFQLLPMGNIGSENLVFFDLKLERFLHLVLDARLRIALYVVLILLLMDLILLRCLRAEHNCLHNLAVALLKYDCTCIE